MDAAQEFMLKQKATLEVNAFQEAIRIGDKYMAKKLVLDSYLTKRHKEQIIYHYEL